MDSERPDDSPSADEGPTRWWNCRRPVDRLTYLCVGALLMVLKYAVEAASIGYITGKFYSPIDFINPLASARRQFTVGDDFLTPLWLLWTLPFVAIAVWMTIRRAIDAGASPWWGMGILVPGLNFAIMAMFACLPTVPEPSSFVIDPRTLLRDEDGPSIASSGGMAMLYGVGAAAAYGLLLTLGTIYVFDSYGAVLFFGVPMVAGAFAAFTYNFEADRSWSATLGVSLMPVILVGACLLLLAFEGAICLVMAAPIMIPLALVGGLIGKAIADERRGDHGRRGELMGCLIVLPLLAFGESRLPSDYEYCVTSSVDIAAPPARVWRHVVDFPEISSPEPWLFELGIAGPKGARIEGRGVGAIRHCDFTTGSFTEPITAWDEPRRLAFDVTEQPEPMFELSPYRDVHPPHLHGSFRSTHGEFVMEELPSGGTRLIGHTWYKLQLAPHAYWTIWTDWIVHRIHMRVLEHVKALAEESVN